MGPVGGAPYRPAGAEGRNRQYDRRVRPTQTTRVTVMTPLAPGAARVGEGSS